MLLGKYNQEKTVRFRLFQVDGVDFEPGATFAAGDIKIMKDEGVEANTTNLPTDEGQGYSLVLTATEMSAARIEIYIVDQTATKVWLDTGLSIETYGNASAEHAFDLDTASIAQTADHAASIAAIKAKTDDMTYTVANQLDVNALAISGDATAADNLEAMYDGTGYADDNAPATQVGLANLSTSSSAISTRAASGTVNVGVVVGGTDYTNTYTKDGTFHTFTEDGSGNMDVEYVFELGGNGVGSEVVMDVYVSGNGDSLAIQAYNEAGAAWETVDTIISSPGTNVVEARVPLDILHTGIGANAGKVRVRAYENGGGLSSVEVNIDKARVDYAVVAESVGYAQGRVWINTDAANTNTNLYKDGTADNPVSTLATAKTIADSLGMKDFHVTSNSTITLLADLNGYNMHGIGYTLNTAGYDLAGTHILHASTINGTITTAGSAAHWDALDATIDVVTADNAHLQGCIFTGTYTFGTSGIVSPEVNMIHCMSGIAGASSPVFTKTPGATLTWSVRDWKGGMTVNGLEAGDTVTIGGGELGTITLNGADASVEVRGIAKAVTDNLTGSPTVNLDGVVIASDVADILVDTAEIGTAGAGLTDLGGMSATMKTQINTEADTALTDYDGPTNTEFEARTPTAAQLAYIVRHAATALPVTFSGTGTTTTGTMALVDGATPSGTSDAYNGRVLVFNLGTLDEQVTDITGYNGTTKVVTVTAVTTAITSSHAAVMV